MRKWLYHALTFVTLSGCAALSGSPDTVPFGEPSAEIVLQSNHPQGIQLNNNIFFSRPLDVCLEQEKDKRLVVFSWANRSDKVISVSASKPLKLFAITGNIRDSDVRAKGSAPTGQSGFSNCYSLVRFNPQNGAKYFVTQKLTPTSCDIEVVDASSGKKVPVKILPLISPLSGVCESY